MKWQGTSRNRRRSWPRRAPQKLRRRRTFGSTSCRAPSTSSAATCLPSSDIQCAKYFAVGGATLVIAVIIWIRVCLFGTNLLETQIIGDSCGREGSIRVGRVSRSDGDRHRRLVSRPELIFPSGSLQSLPNCRQSDSSLRPSVARSEIEITISTLNEEKRTAEPEKTTWLIGVVDVIELKMAASELLFRRKRDPT